MNKKKAGLPATFELQVEEPVQLGDYLDDQFESKTPSAQLGDAEVIKKPVEPRNHEDAQPEPRATVPRKTEPKKRLKEPPRKQVNMKPETLRKVEVLLDLIRDQGPQRDLAASEMFDAIISAVYESREFLELSRLPKRGRWGSPTAAAFVESLKKSFKLAIQND